ncbi:MAG: START domain-containing protein [Planctomycetes bacterium]|nr:START domain-containing protein [Planctomycetota bacterium]
MKLRSISLWLVVMCGTGLLASDSKEARWTLAKNKQGIKVFTRKVKGIDFKEFKGVMTVKTSLTSLVALLGDAKAMPDWMANCTRVEVLKQISDQETYTYTLSKAAWPVTDRDAVLHNVTSQDGSTLVVTIKVIGKPDHIARKKNIVRIKRIESVWQFTPKPDGFVEVVYQALSDPSGTLPAWLVNSAVVSQPYSTLLKMRKVIKRKTYQDATLAFIKERQE